MAAKPKIGVFITLVDGRITQVISNRENVAVYIQESPPRTFQNFSPSEYPGVHITQSPFKAKTDEPLLDHLLSNYESAAFMFGNYR
jgi:hypothetical protein